MDDEELEEVAEQMGCTVEDLKLLGERVEAAVNAYTQEIAKAESGTVTCIGCGAPADFHRTGSIYEIECECGMNASGQIPEDLIQHTRH